MSKWETIVRYDGPILADHKMDVNDIAPAMLSLAELCRRANTIANGDRASVKLLINLNVEQHCAAFGFEVVQTLLDHAKALLEDQNVKTAKDILEYIGVVGQAAGYIGLPVVGLFALLKLLKGRKPESATPARIEGGRDVVQINVGGDVYLTYAVTAKMLADPVSMKSAKEVLRPARKEGYETVEFESERKVTEVLTKQDAILIDAIPTMESSTPGATIPESYIKAKVKIRKAVYEGTGKWTIQYDKSREMTMGDEGWLADFQSNKIQAPPGSYLDVDITVSAIHLDKDGKPLDEPLFTITKVNGVDPPREQLDLLDKTPPISK